MDVYRIEYIDGEWTVRSEDGYDTYYFGDNRRDCEGWIEEHNGKAVYIRYE